jgi:hypothetical protein
VLWLEIKKDIKMAYGKGGFKPCKTCKTPGTCSLAGKCLKGGM